MWKQVKIVIKNTFLYDVINGIRDVRSAREWEKTCKQGPPPNIVKQRIVKEYAGKFGIRVFIESGTYLGSMVEAVKKTFRRIYSIEINEQLYKKAKSRFSKYGHISILHGDSAIELPRILINIHEPVLFWLDGHYSGGITGKGKEETPILEELQHIFGHPVEGHVIMIDDARCFTGEGDYPTLEEVRDLVLGRYLDYAFEVEYDIIRCWKTVRSLPY